MGFSAQRGIGFRKAAFPIIMVEMCTLTMCVGSTNKASRWLEVLIFASLLCTGSAKEQLKAELPAALKALAAADRIEIRCADPAFGVSTHHGMIRGTNCTNEEMASYAALFAREFALYPQSLIRRTGLRRIVLCRELSFEGQHRRAIPDFEHDVLYLDAAHSANPTYLKRVIHHEFFHIIDYKDDGLVYADQQWAALNRADFKYGKGGKEAQSVKTASRLTGKFPGFLDYYATTGVEEDKAELFALLMVDPDYVKQRAQSDAVLRRKVDAMKKLLLRFCPDVNDAFWSKVAKARD